ncbi:MAG: hypothetical protein KGS72_25940 [Cyanobacteria bacterium REEB67]|nr:hypothetical protein [Cyanobacteria bacterium REEB67]
MNRAVIVQAAVCRQDPVEGVFVVESKELEQVIGVGETEAEAWKVFGELVDDFLEAIDASAKPLRED